MNEKLRATTGAGAVSVADTKVAGAGRPDRDLSPEEIAAFVGDALARLDADGRRVLVLVPDGTRTMPMPLMFELMESSLGARASALDYLVALGTHPPMSDEQIGRLIGRPVSGGMAGASRIFNHRWDRPETFVRLGALSAAETRDLSEGRLSVEVPVSLNRLVLDYDHLIVCGPVFPHEVVGFSGGAKYFFPGISGPEMIDFTHWLGALITSAAVIGTARTPVRAVIDRAAAFIDRAISCFSLVVTDTGVRGIYFGDLQESWKAAAALSAECHVEYVDQPFCRALSVMPRMYDDLWTAAKGMYKVEPAMADGGEVVIFAPHIDEVSHTHGRLIEEIGYHCRDYFLAQWDRFGRYPGGVLAHSTHLKGAGSYDAATGTETARISVVLATGIPEERCRRLNLGYLDPASVSIDDWRGREEERVVAIPRAGERLYRLRTKTKD
ncbi:MAG: lactate racemase domain-containing protein [Vicinamibacterales bacterium]